MGKPAQECSFLSYRVVILKIRLFPGFGLTFQNDIVKNTYKISLVLIPHNIPPREEPLPVAFTVGALLLLKENYSCNAL